MYAMNPTPTTAASRPLGGDTNLDGLFESIAREEWHIHPLAPMLPEIIARAGQLMPQRRTAWIDGLRTAWNRHGWAMSSAPLIDLMTLSAAWNDWPLTTAVGERLAENGELPDRLRLTLAGAWRRLGDGDAALDHARRYLLAKPDCQAGVDEYGSILRWRAFRGGYGIDREPLIDEGGLILDPLAHHHLEDFAWQYFDPAIAELCCLPRFESDDRWHRWLDETYAYGDQLTFAVIHPGWGFIGTVSLILHQGVGFFYYWLGPDFQGRGLGPRAVSLLLREAGQRWEMHTCYAKVFDYNTPSRKALVKMGFDELGIQAVPPNEREIFYRYGAANPRAATIDQLHTLLERMGSSTVVAAPIHGRGAA